MNDATTYMLQRASAAVMVPLVIFHLGVIIYAIDGGLTTAEIISRTRSNIFWPLFYGLFTVAVSIHAPLGLRNIIREWTNWRGQSLDIATAVLVVVLLSAGMRAIWGLC